MLIDVDGNNLSKLLKMFAWMEICGSIGHSTDFHVGYDGDGSASYTFKPKDKDVAKAYEQLKKEINKQRDDTGEDIKNFNFEQDKRVDSHLDCLLFYLFAWIYIIRLSNKDYKGGFYDAK